LVLGGVLFANSSLVNILKDLVETELAEALGSISDKSRGPTLKSALSKQSILMPGLFVKS